MALQERRRQSEEARRGNLVIIPFCPAAGMRLEIPFHIRLPRVIAKIQRSAGGGIPLIGQNGAGVIKYKAFDNEVISRAV